MIKAVCLLLCFCGIMSLGGWCGVRIYDGVQYDRLEADYQLRAGHANDIATAIQNIDVAIAYAKTVGLTSGYTSILWTSPDEDIGYWYHNLIEARVLLDTVHPDAGAMEISNVLLRLHESLARTADPDGISIFPNNIAFAFWGWLSVMAIVIFGFAAMLELDD